MSDKEMDERWRRHKREEAEPAIMEVRRYTVNGKPTCMAWYGLGNHARMACQFIGTSHMGSKSHCLILAKEIWPEEETGLLAPVDGCPLWKD